MKELPRIFLSIYFGIIFSFNTTAQSPPLYPNTFPAIGIVGINTPSTPNSLFQIHGTQDLKYFVG